MKLSRFFALLISVFLLCFCCTFVSAEAPISEAKLSAISSHCDKIKISLRAIQKSDSSVRSHLGHSYESIVSNYMIPLNTRLVKNSSPDTDLSLTQAEFAAKRAEFNSNYVAYSMSLDSLINFDCGSDPGGFYSLLDKTRSYRSQVEKDVSSLDALIDKFKKQVNSLKGSLK